LILFFVVKDLFSVYLLLLFTLLIYLLPTLFLDAENFIKANYQLSPIHIQPEWYFLYIYAILRAIPNKLGGVLIAVLSICLLVALFIKVHLFQTVTIKENVLLYRRFFLIFTILSWLGIKPVEVPYLQISIAFTFLYFLLMLLIYISSLKLVKTFS